jgi:hypothetical protein
MLFAIGVILRLVPTLIIVPRLENDQDSSIKELLGDLKEFLVFYSPLKIFREIKRRILRRRK